MTERSSNVGKSRLNTSVDTSNTPKKFDLANAVLTSQEHELIDKIASLCSERQLPDHVSSVVEASE